LNLKQNSPDLELKAQEIEKRISLQKEQYTLKETELQNSLQEKVTQIEKLNNSNNSVLFLFSFFFFKKNPIPFFLSFFLKFYSFFFSFLAHS